MGNDFRISKWTILHFKHVKNLFTCLRPNSEILALLPILSIPSKNMIPLWAFAKSNSALRYNLVITELIVSLLSLQPSISMVRLPRRSKNFFRSLIFDDFPKLWRRNKEFLNGEPWTSGLQK